MNIRAKIFGGGKAAEEPPLIPAKKPIGVKAESLNSIPVVRDTTRKTNTRGEDRHRLSQENVRARHAGSDYPVQLINLSGGGAMVAGDFQPQLWDSIELHLGDDGVIECAVCWLKGDRVGLEFAHETRLDCSADEQAVLLREVIARSFPDVEFEASSRPAEKQQASDEQRGARRHPLIWSGTLHHDYQSTPVRLRNISSSGAQIECQAPLPVGAEPLLEIGEAGSVFATVTWIVGDQVGLKFNEPFDLSQLANARPEVAPARWERPAYLKTAATVDSPWADEWRRQSLGELRNELEGFLKR